MGKEGGFPQHFARSLPLRRRLGAFPENHRTKEGGK